MVNDSAIIHNPNKLEDFIDFDPSIEPPLALQLGGNSPSQLGDAVELCEAYKGGHFSEINLNCGCPSNKAKRGGFGAELMLDPELVRQIVHEMNRRSHKTEITVKCRIGTSKKHEWEDLVEFIDACKQGGTHRVIVHSRICVLNGLSPAQNRTIPPLQYDVVHRLVDTFPDMEFHINGGIRSFQEADMHLGRPAGRTHRSAIPIDDEEEEEGGGGGVKKEADTEEESGTVPLWSLASPVHGVMIGREAYGNPWLLADADRYYFDRPNPSLSRREVLERYLAYCERAQDNDEFKCSAAVLCRPLHNFFTGCGGHHNRRFKRMFDHLIKERVTNGKHLHNTRQLRIDDLVWEAVHECIPESRLDERMGPEGYMIPA